MGKQQRGGWRQAAENAGRARELPVAALLGLGVAMPICLFASGAYAIHAEEVMVPGSGSFLGGRDPALDHASGILTGAVADGLGIGLIGIAIILHSQLVWRRMGSLRRWARAGLLAGCLVTAAGVTYAVMG